MLKYYQIGDEKIYVIILTLRNTSLWRRTNVLKNIKNNPKINRCFGIDGNDKLLTQNLIRKYNIYFPKPKLSSYILENYGRLGRWLSTIMFMKYSMDTNRKIVVLEDDLLLPVNFDFQFERYKDMKNIVRLGMWGDAYFFEPNSCRDFFKQHLYTRGIVTNDDNEIIDEYKAPLISVISRKNYGVPLLYREHQVSSIKARARIDNFSNIPKNNEMTLLTKRIWSYNSHNDIYHKFIQ